MPDAPADKCPHCSDDLIPGKLYCANCGQPVVAADQKAAIDAYIAAKVAQEVALKTQGESAIVRDLAFKAEDEVWKRMKRYGWIVGLFIGLVSLIGFGSIQDANRKIVEEAKGRVEPMVKDVEKRSQDAQKQIGSVEKRIPEITSTLNKTSALADEQRKRIEGQAAEIATKLKGLDSAVARANQMAIDFERNMSSTQKRFDDATKRFDTQLTQVTKSVTRTAVTEAFPNIDQEPFVTIGRIRMDQVPKNANEKWVNVYVTESATAKGIISGKRLEELSSELRNAGYTPLLGYVSIQGRLGGVLERIDQGSNQDSDVIFFRETFRDEAKKLNAIVARFVTLSPSSPRVAQITGPSSYARRRIEEVLKDRKLDAQIFISARFD